MKRITIALFTVLFALTAINAQGKKSLKEASKSLSEFNKNPFSNTQALADAKAHLATAFEDAEIASDPKSYITKGELYTNIADSQIKAKLLNPEATLSDETAALEALKAYTKALEMGADDKKVVKNAIKGISDLEGILNNLAADLYSSENYAGSFQNFEGTIAASELLQSKGEKSVLDDKAMLSEKAYFAGLTAYYSEDLDKTIKYLSQAKETGTSEGPLYQVLAEAATKAGNETLALSTLEEGRKLFPENSGLLFAEINYYLVKGQLKAMTGKLEEALEQEPDNVSVILTLGQVYDQLVAKATESGDEALAQEYSDNALKYYQKVLAITPDDFSANYSIGALYYNKAASFTPSLNEAAEDFSVAGNKKYEEIKSTMSGFFDQALPYFLKADGINGEDSNTLIALKEIYVRKDDMAKSNEYKERLEALGSN